MHTQTFDLITASVTHLCQKENPVKTEVLHKISVRFYFIAPFLFERGFLKEQEYRLYTSKLD